MKNVAKNIKEWLETFFKMLDDTTKAIKEIFDKYAIFVFSTAIFVGFWFCVIVACLELINNNITPLPMFKFKPYQGYIYAFPDSDRAKNYRLKYKKTENGFYMFFPNGGSIYFEDCEEFNLDGYSFTCASGNDSRDWEFRGYKIDVKD